MFNRKNLSHKEFVRTWSGKPFPGSSDVRSEGRYAIQGVIFWKASPYDVSSSKISTQGIPALGGFHQVQLTLICNHPGKQQNTRVKKIIQLKISL